MAEEDVDLSRLKGKPHLRGFYLSGFKGSPHSGVSVPLRPLTVVYGPNSGGKSTILKALSSISQTRHRNSLFAVKDYWTSSGIWFDLGPKGQVLHRGKPTKNTFTIGFEFADISTRFPWVDSNGIKLARRDTPLSAVACEVLDPGPADEPDAVDQPVIMQATFELPEKLPKNHYLLFSPTPRPPPREDGIPICIGENSDFSLEDLKEITDYDGDKQFSDEPNLTIVKVEGLDGGNYVDVTYLLSSDHPLHPSQLPVKPDDDGPMSQRAEESRRALEKSVTRNPVLWGFRVLQRDNRIDLRFRADGGGYDLDGIERHEERNKEYHKILSLNKGDLKGKRAYFVQHHNIPNISVPGTSSDHEEWGEEDLKATQTLAKLILPLKYKVEVSKRDEKDLEEDSGEFHHLLLSCKKRASAEAGWRLSEFQKMLRGIGDGESDEQDDRQRQDSVIEAINRLCGKYGFRGMSNKEKIALQKFLNPATKINLGEKFSPENSTSRKKPLYQLGKLYEYVEPRWVEKTASEEFVDQLMTREVEDGANQEFGSRSEIVRIFGLYRNSLKPYVELDGNLTLGSASRRDGPSNKWGSLPTNSRYQFIPLYWSTVQYIEEIVEHMTRVDYLSASRLSPERVYSSIEVSRAGVRGERSIANLFGRFPPNSPQLKALNNKMEEVVGMRVKFSELMGPYKQGTGLIDVRVGRPGKRKVAQLPDVGFGVSQTLPVLAALAEADFSAADDLGPMLVIEEAESNLHPAAQARLMRVILQDLPLVEGPSIVMETHSEHFLKTILNYLSEEGDLTDDDVAIVYVDEDESGMFAVHMETRNGEFLHPWPRRGRWDDPTSPII